MLQELDRALQTYMAEWRLLVAARSDQVYFKALKPTAVCWKCVDLDDFDRRCALLRAVSLQAHLAWLDGRWLATFRVQDSGLPQGITVIKLFQRRPASSDAPGLDHVDFYAASPAHDVLVSEPGLKWTEERSGDRCKWLSIWFAGGEAKLRTDTVLRVCAAELSEAERQILY